MNRETLKELSYEGNLGVHELMLFYDKAAKSQIKMLQALLNSHKIAQALSLIEKVVGYKLKGEGKMNEGKPPEDRFSKTIADVLRKNRKKTTKYGGPVKVTSSSSQEGEWKILVLYEKRAYVKTKNDTWPIIKHMLAGTMSYKSGMYKVDYSNGVAKTNKKVISILQAANLMQKIFDMTPSKRGEH